MEVTFTLSLPRDGSSVAVVRRITSDALRVLRVAPEAVTDLEVAVSEACSNVLRHAAGDDDYSVRVRVTDDVAIIEVIDAGHGFDSADLGRGDAAPSAERGRGIQLMRALVDRVLFESRPESGTVVHLEKRLDLLGDSPLRQPAGGRHLDS